MLNFTERDKNNSSTEASWEKNTLPQRKSIRENNVERELYALRNRYKKGNVKHTLLEYPLYEQL